MYFFFNLISSHAFSGVQMILFSSNVNIFFSFTIKYIATKVSHKKYKIFSFDCHCVLPFSLVAPAVQRILFISNVNIFFRSSILTTSGVYSRNAHSIWAKYVIWAMADFAEKWKKKIPQMQDFLLCESGGLVNFCSEQNWFTKNMCRLIIKEAGLVSYEVF